MKKPVARGSRIAALLSLALLFGCATILPYPAGSSYEAAAVGSLLVAKDIRVVAIDGVDFPAGSSPRTAFILQLAPGKHRLSVRSGSSVRDPSSAELYCDIEAGRRYRLEGLRVSSGGDKDYRMIFTLKEVAGK